MPRTISVNGRLRAELFEPAGVAANGNAVVIAYGSEGMTTHLSGPWGTMIREFAEELAAQGFSVLIPDYLAVTGTPPDPHVWLQIGTHGSTWQRSIKDAATYARTLPGLAGAKVGLLGFSLGGHLCLRLRGTTPVLVAFYAPAAGLQPHGGQLDLHVQLHQGDQDFLVRPAEAQAIEAILAGEQARVELHWYPGANHGFTGNNPANAAARRNSLQRAVAFFSQYL